MSAGYIISLGAPPAQGETSQLEAITLPRPAKCLCRENSYVNVSNIVKDSCGSNSADLSASQS